MKEVASILKVSGETVRTLIKSGELDYLMFGDKKPSYRITKESFDRMLRKRLVTSQFSASDPIISLQSVKGEYTDKFKQIWIDAQK